MSPRPAIFDHIVAAMRRPEGTFSFQYSSADAFRDNHQSGVILEIPSRGQYFRLDRTEDRTLRFFHSSPGTGTRVASISLDGLPDFEKAYLAFTWSPEETHFYCGPHGIHSELLHGVGAPSPISFRVGEDGSVFQLGDTGVQVMGARVRRARALVLAPTAIEVWNNTIQAIEILWSGKSEQGFLFEVLQATQSLSMLVTGLESYAKTRLLEIEKEGVEPAFSALFKAFSSKAVRESDHLTELQTIAGDTGQSIFSVVLEDLHINLQNVDNLKTVFKASYGIRIGEIGLDSDTISKLRALIRYRHRIIHVSPLLGMLNESEVPPDEPVFANREFSERATKVFSAMVESLHGATTSLRPKGVV